MSFKGKELLLKRGDGAATEVFSTIGGFRSNDVKINNEFIDTSNKDTDLWRQMIEGGIRSMSTTGAGIYKADQAAKDAIDDAINGSISNYQIIVPGLGTFEGPFAVNEFAITGENGGAVEYTASYDSADPIAFTAE